MEEEIEVTEINNTWELVEKPSDKEVIGVKWIYKVKHNFDSSFKRNKARLVVKGYAQQPGIDYDETFSPIEKMNTIRMVFSLATIKDWTIHQMDV